MFGHRIGFACQRGFAGGKRGGLQDQRIRRDDIAGPDAQDVAGNDRFDLDFPESAVALDLGFERH